MNKKVIGVLLLVGILVLLGCCESVNFVFNTSMENTFSDKEFDSFEFEDINGDVVTEDFFKNNKLTMINIWTYDSTSMSDFQELYDDNADRGFNILGVIVDANSEDKEEAVREIVENL